MSGEITVSVDSAQQLVILALKRHNTSELNATSVAAALIAAEIDGQAGHGLSRLASYAAQAASGKVDGHAVPRVVAERTCAVRIDAGSGFAFPAIDLALEELSTRAMTGGVASAAIFRSHHFGQAGYHVERLAEKGLVAMVFGNSPKAIAPWGGSQGVFGTNPIAFAAPRRNDDPLVIDLSLSKVARGKVMVAARRGDPIPEGWALDKQGNPTTDAKAALEGTMLPMGDAKGAALVLMVEILAAALTGANFGYEASSFFTAEGDSPAVGQLLIALDPQISSGGGFHPRLEDLLGTMLDQSGVRIPGSRRFEARRRVASGGITLSADLHAEITALAQAV